MRSTINSHPDRPAICAGLAKRIPLRKLGRRYGVSIDALHRFKRKLMRDAPEIFIATQACDWKVKPEELEALRLETSEGWLRNVRTDLGKILFYRDQAVAEGDPQMAAQWTAHVIRYFKLLGEAAAQLQAHSINIQNNFYNSEECWSFQTKILAALADHPAARADVLRALEGVGGSTAPAMITVTPAAAHEASV